MKSYSTTELEFVRLRAAGDAVRAYRERMIKWLGEQLYDLAADPSQFAYRRAWGDAIKHVISEVREP